jgi:hypothetical protein
MTEPSNDAAHWHSCAEEARAIAALLKIADAKRMMYKIAGGFEHRAERAVRQLARENARKSGTDPFPCPGGPF